MIKDILSLWETNKNFKVEENNEVYDSTKLEALSEKIKNNLLDIDNRWENKTVYIDIKNRMSFILLFIALIKLKSKIVLLPIEIKQDDFIDDNIIYISDNKKTSEGIYLNEDLSISLAENFYFSDTNKVIYNNITLFLYTSGSTGKAKLIPKNDDNLVTELKELKKILDIVENEIFYFTPPLYHIYGLLFGFLLPLYSNGHLIIDYHFTPESIAKFVDERDINYFISIPAYYNMFFDLDLVKNFKNCKKLTSSSSLLPKSISENFLKENIKILEIYGSTETGGIGYRIGAIDDSWRLFSYVKVIDRKFDLYLDEVENKNIYELIINSPSISILYDMEIGYNTGDLIEFSGNKLFRLLGRNTRFVKIKGKRVDLNYVFKKVMNYLENLINFEIKDDNLFIGEKDEIIFVIFEFNFPKNNTEMKKELKDLLPGYSVPKFFINMKIPKNSMGKINMAKIDNIIDGLKKNNE